ncbi:MAG: hypothetical protein AB1861_08785 [Cyanobacteriota bacterium]
MEKSDTFLNLVGWVIAGALFATIGVIYYSWTDRDQERTAVVSQEAPIAIEQRGIDTAQ